MNNKFNINQNTTPRNLSKPNNINNIFNNFNSSIVRDPFQNNNNNNNDIKLAFTNNTIKSPTAINHNLLSEIKNNNKLINIKQDEIDHKINLENIILGKDKRTTLMIRNIPNKYTLHNLVDEISLSFLGKYDYINLPIDYERKLNLGYAFINFVDPLHIVLFFDNYNHKKWLKYRSDKKIELNYAEKQGKKDINCKDENTYFASEDKKLLSKKLNLKIEFPIVISFCFIFLEIFRVF